MKLKTAFVVPNVDAVKLSNSYTYENNPVNLAHCKYIYRSTIKAYGSNKEFPSIKFYGCDTEWAYETREERDFDYKLILQGKSPMTI